MVSLHIEGMAIDYHDKALKALAASREAKPKAKRKTVNQAARQLGWAGRAGAVDGNAERTLRRFRVEAITAAGIDDETPSAEREAFLRRVDRGMATGVGMALGEDESPELAGINYSRVEQHRLDHLERQLGRRQAEQDLRGESGDATAPTYVDVAEILDGGFEVPVADAGGLRADGKRLAYLGTVTTFAGETGAGKTWIAMAFVVDEMRRLS